MEISVDFDTFTLGELEQIEEVSGQSFEDIFKAGKSPSIRAVVALVWVLTRRTDPSFTLDDARATPLSSIDFKDVTKPESDPTDAADASV